MVKRLRDTVSDRDVYDLMQANHSLRLKIKRERMKMEASSSGSKLAPVTVQPLGYHRPQEIVANWPTPYKLLITGRRWGKTVLQLGSAIKAVTHSFENNPTSNPIVLLAEPTLNMARKLLFRPLEKLFASSPAVADINKSTMTIDFKLSKKGRYHPSIVVTGLNDGDGDRARGSKIWHYGGDEVQDHKASIFEEVILPAMGDVPGSTALLSGTPKGKSNHTYKRYMRWLTDPDWGCFRFKSIDNPHFPQASLDRLTRILPPKVLAQELEADFVNFDGQIFEFFNDSDLNGNVVDYYIPRQDCILTIDWGDVHPAVVVHVRSPSGIYQLVDAWTNHLNSPVSHDAFKMICLEMARKWNPNYAFCDPTRPANIEEFQATPELSMLEPAFSENLQGIAQVNSIMFQGRYLVHKDADRTASLLVQVGEDFDHTIPNLIDEISSYHRAKDKFTGLYLDGEAPHQFCHRVDCIRYCVASMEITVFKHNLESLLPVIAIPQLDLQFVNNLWNG